MKKTKTNFEKDFRSSHAASTLFYSRSKQQQPLRATTGRKKETEAAGMMTSKMPFLTYDAMIWRIRGETSKTNKLD
jgi:hypothetical protein